MGRQFDQAGIPINRCSLDRCDLMLTQTFADDVEICGEGSVAKRSLTSPGKRRLDGGGQGLFRAISDCALASAAAKNCKYEKPCSFQRSKSGLRALLRWSAADLAKGDNIIRRAEVAEEVRH